MTATSTGSPFLKWTGALLLVLALTGFVWSVYVSPRIYGGTGNSIAANNNMVSEGPRCDGIPRTIQVGKQFYPGRVGCIAYWGIRDDSPTPCVWVVDTNQKVVPRAACRGNEATFTELASGWKATDDGDVLVDVIYRDK